MCATSEKDKPTETRSLLMKCHDVILSGIFHTNNRCYPHASRLRSAAYIPNPSDEADVAQDENVFGFALHFMRTFIVRRGNAHKQTFLSRKSAGRDVTLAPSRRVASSTSLLQNERKTLRYRCSSRAIASMPVFSLSMRCRPPVRSSAHQAMLSFAEMW